MNKNNRKLVNKIGWIASIMAIIMFSSYIDQIRLNILGQKGSLLLPIATTVNCVFWLLYGILKENRDMPLIVCNILGILLASLTVITVFV